MARDKAEKSTISGKRYVTCDFRHPSCLPGFAHYETESCINPKDGVMCPSKWRDVAGVNQCWYQAGHEGPHSYDE